MFKGVYAISVGLTVAWGRRESKGYDRLSPPRAHARRHTGRSIQCAAVILSYCRIIHYGCTASLSVTRARRHAWGGSVRWRAAWWLTQARRTCACNPPVQHEPSSTTINPACSADLEMDPCPGWVLSWALCRIPLSPKTSAELTGLSTIHPRARCAACNCEALALWL
jgi:hypothetical protein